MGTEKKGKEALLCITANTCVRDYGQYVSSFTLEFVPEYDPSGINIGSFTFAETAKHPAAGHESFGAWKVEKEGDSLTVFVDPFLYNDKYTGALVLDDESISLTKADVPAMKVDVVDDFEALTTENGLAYRLLVPESDEPLPLVVTFHGNGERGTDNYKQMVNNRVTTKWGEPQSQAIHKCIVLGPQSNNSWSDDELADVRKIIEGLIAEKKADPKRIYASGLAAFQSTIRFAAANTDLLAGVISIIYWKKYNPDLTTLTELPMWLCIGENDTTGEAASVKEAYEYFKNELHNENVRCSIYPAEEMMSYGLYGGLTHWGWIPTLNNREICDWLFAQCKE